VRRSTKSVRTDSERGGLGEAKRVIESTSKDERREEKRRDETYGLECRRGIGGGGLRRALALALLG
jgi:hypothetical protein